MGPTEQRRSSALNLDQGTIAAARTGGLDLERLIDDIWPAAFRISMVLLRDRGLAEDAAQDACVAIAASLHTLKDDDAFYAWSYKIVVRTARLIERKRPRTVSIDSSIKQTVDIERSSTLDLECALATLPFTQRAAILLHYYGGLKSREIGSALGIPPSSVRFHLMLARRALKKLLEADEVVPSIVSQEAFNHVH